MRTPGPEVSGGLPVGHSRHGLACPGIQAERSYSVERERARCELSIPVLRGQCSWHHRDSWRPVSVLDQTSEQVQEPQARGRRGILPKPNKVTLWATSPQRFSECGSQTSRITSPGAASDMEMLAPSPGPGLEPSGLCEIRSPGDADACFSLRTSTQPL